MTRTLTTSAIMYFNPLPPHGGRRRLRRFLQNVPYFNPLPPHGGRLKDTSELPDDLVFQSTPSTRRETNMSSAKQVIMHISIHSLHTEGDPDKNVFICSHDVFQSTPSTRRETQEEADRQGITLFQSTPSTRRETCFIAWSGICKFYFNPLPPHGGRLRSMIIPSFQKSISIHSLHTEGDDKVRGFVHKHKAFQSTPSTRRETQGKRFCA